MKNFKRFISLSMLVVCTLFLMTGCEPKREEIKFDGDEGSLTFNLKVDEKYKISTDKADLRTSREQGALIGNGFKIGIEFSDDFDYFFKSDWDELKEARKDRDDYKEVTYSNLKGIQYFYSGYMCYDIILPVENNNKYFVVLTVYGDKDNEESTKAAIQNEEVLDVLNHITSITAKK